MSYNSLSPEHTALRAKVEALGVERLAPIADRVDESDALEPEVLKILVDAGLFRLMVPAEYGGEGVSVTSICIVREELSRFCAHADSLFALQGIGSYPIALAGSDALKSEYLPAVAAGEKIASLAMTEAGAGSDVSGMQSTARLDGDNYVLNGEKKFISNAGYASFSVYFAKTSEGGAKSISAFVVDADSPGFEFTGSIALLAPHVVGGVRLTDCVVPRDRLLGEEGGGFKLVMQSLDIFRTSVGASAIGAGRAALDAALAYARGRIQFGRPLADLQATQIKLADMTTDLWAARHLVYNAAQLRDAGGNADLTLHASMAKLFASEAAGRIVDQALQIHGGEGLRKGSPVERLYRQVRGMRVYEGSSEIQRIVIAREALKEQP